MCFVKVVCLPSFMVDLIRVVALYLHVQPSWCSPDKFVCFLCLLSLRRKHHSCAVLAQVRDVEMRTRSWINWLSVGDSVYNQVHDVVVSCLINVTFTASTAALSKHRHISQFGLFKLSMPKTSTVTVTSVQMPTIISSLSILKQLTRKQSHHRCFSQVGAIWLSLQNI